ncbi:anaerobic magnesium-protoporphyrin IX monomethyl ester cyclase-like [Ylistrum balloti]|uniref:anaerobic magnesium-protoporphyrin IX monomethyl ester cyclase-like n=1 Tax=Ylistrum balloti TaxID=509963 RepID=UPI00290593B2|nr:anaerobic magnesium-protoporphyrin IX monomethyl ester cyclase-like [Ylistrum balloti]
MPDKVSYEAIVPTLQKLQPDVVGLTAYTYVLYDIYAVCRLVKQYVPKCKIVLGGPHNDIYPHETIQQDFVDYLVKGEGEQTFAQLLDHLTGTRQLKDTPGIYFQAPEGNIVFTGERTPIQDINALPIPARDLAGLNQYYSIINPGYRETTIISSRGCPFRCNFCDVGGRKYRYRCAKSVAQEMRQCEETGFEFVQFMDDTFNLFPKKVKALCHEIIAQKITIPWCFRGRVDQVDEEMFDLLKRANCKRIFFGVESGSDEMLAYIGKRITRAQTERAFILAKQAGIETVGYFMLGFVKETREQMLETIAFAKKIQADYVHVTITIPLPGTPLWDEVCLDPNFPKDYLRDYTHDPVKNFELLPWSQTHSYEELYALNKKFYREFYFRPSYLWRRLKQVRSLKELWRKLRAAWNLMLFQFDRLVQKSA